MNLGNIVLLVVLAAIAVFFLTRKGQTKAALLETVVSGGQEISLQKGDYFRFNKKSSVVYFEAVQNDLEEPAFSGDRVEVQRGMIGDLLGGVLLGTIINPNLLFSTGGKTTLKFADGVKARLIQERVVYIPNRNRAIATVLLLVGTMIQIGTLL